MESIEAAEINRYIGEDESVTKGDEDNVTIDCIFRGLVEPEKKIEKVKRTNRREIILSGAFLGDEGGEQWEVCRLPTVMNGNMTEFAV